MDNLKTDSQWAQQVLDECSRYQNPQLSKDIDIVWAISGRGSYTEQTTKYLLSSPEFSGSKIYKSDDRKQTDFAIELIKEITALKLGKDVDSTTKEDILRSGPTLVYNGFNSQNEALLQAVNDISFPLPSQKVRIEKLADIDDPKIANTRTQFERFPQDILEELIKTDKRIAMVSSRWHIPRIARVIDSEKVLKIQPLWKDVKICYFVPKNDHVDLPSDLNNLTDDEKDIWEIIKGEGRRINEYSKKGDLDIYPRYS